MEDRDQGFRIATRERQWLVGVGITGPFELAEARTEAAWESLVARVADLPEALHREEWLSACHIRESELTCYVGPTSDQPVGDLPGDLVTFPIPRHEYLVARHAGGREELGNLYAAMFAWLQRNGREVNREILWLERYTSPPTPGSDPDMEIWLPLRPQEPARP
jgi:predicted transcriptional regulator YdeE